MVNAVLTADRVRIAELSKHTVAFSQNMTIIITAGNSEYVIQFSDRRLSSGKIVIDEQSNKATAFNSADGRFAIGFTGLAKIGNFSLQAWLVDAIGRCAPPDYTIRETAERLAKETEALFATHPLIKSLTSLQRRLTIMLSGYVYRPDGNAHIGNIWITNFQDFAAGVDLPEAKPNFSVFGMLERERSLVEVLSKPPTTVQRVGAWTAMNLEDESILRRVLETARSVETIIDAGVSMVRRISDRPESFNTVGKDVAVIIVPSDVRQPVTTRIRPSTGRDQIGFVDTVQCILMDDGTPNVLYASEMKIEVDDPVPGEPAIQPKLGRNDPCWCNGGLKFKYCHGR